MEMYVYIYIRLIIFYENDYYEIMDKILYC